eukprot:CAMPEP_0175062722 /NCGR_PEP_ID=MMETSP0052_2-20121109/14331_1 /TAXON_ID=51329 ORGANISM="Polytomella parva, Strain SAG 63-3" /NCGR_SAMPLE_ID=MMETSP0052_2 /ASSEMBLY_ACC=CAM_ASM_000194 /LENGTH=303 /DNA_ID=CAMNT_0016328785 /DNA_START=48 /DNA_END=956 /DNA_ORIENTATION=-
MSYNSSALLLNHEIASVITAMRHSSKWAVVPRYYEEQLEPNKSLETFKALRVQTFRWKDWKILDPMIYFDPFLNLITAKDVSGPITGAATVSLHKLLASNLLTLDTFNVDEVINRVVEDVTQCKFETFSPVQDEIILLNIVQVLGLAVQCEAGRRLTDESVCKAIQASFMLGDPVTKPKEHGETMSYFSRRMCSSIIETIFRRFGEQLALEYDSEAVREEEEAATRENVDETKIATSRTPTAMMTELVIRAKAKGDKGDVGVIVKEKKEEEEKKGEEEDRESEMKKNEMKKNEMKKKNMQFWN